MNEHNRDNEVPIATPADMKEKMELRFDSPFARVVSILRVVQRDVLRCESDAVLLQLGLGVGGLTGERIVHFAEMV